MSSASDPAVEAAFRRLVDAIEKMNRDSLDESRGPAVDSANRLAVHVALRHYQTARTAFAASSRDAAAVAWGVENGAGAIFETMPERHIAEDCARDSANEDPKSGPYRVVPLYASPPAPSAEVVEALDLFIKDFSDLIAESRGVDGLHKNGDIATWDELREGGRFDSWLGSFDALLKARSTLRGGAR